MKDIRQYKKKGGSLRIEVGQKDTIINDYKRLANSIIQPSAFVGYLPLILYGMTFYGTYYFYKKNKLKTAAVFGAPLLFIFSQPIINRLTPKSNQEDIRI